MKEKKLTSNWETSPKSVKTDKRSRRSRPRSTIDKWRRRSRPRSTRQNDDSTARQALIKNAYEHEQREGRGDHRYASGVNTASKWRRSSVNATSEQRQNGVNTASKRRQCD